MDDPGDRKVIGNSTSRFQFGANAGVSFGKASTSTSCFRAWASATTWLGSHAMFPFGGAGADGVFHPIYYNQTDYWTAKSYDPESPDYMVAANPDAKLFRIYGQEGNVSSNTRTSDKYLQNAAYLRIKNLTLGYTFPAKWMNKLSISRVQSLRQRGKSPHLHIAPQGLRP